MMDEDKLKERAEERYEKEKQQQEEALQEIAQGPNLENYETVQMGEAEIRVKCWVPGSVSDSFADIMQAMDSGDETRMFRSCRKIAMLLAELCADEPYDSTQFWETYYNKYGPEGAISAFEIVAMPAMSNMEDLQSEMDIEGRSDALGNSQSNRRAGR